ncbi:MAG: M15 family metallopeptidase [Leptospira sp.]|nr:M15 family metallopeptidase [Leptospira sp.]
MSLAVEQVKNSIELVTPRLKTFWNDLHSVLPEARLYETFRENSRQDYLYAQGRTRSGQIITYATAGNSPHNHGLAFDVVGVNFLKKEEEIRTLLEKNKDITWGKDFWGMDPTSKKKFPFPDESHFQIKNWKRIVPGKIGKSDIVFHLLAVSGIAILNLRSKRK